MCDESKCLSTGLLPSDGGDSSSSGDIFNCYAQGPGTLYPYVCADGYVGQRIPDVDVSTSSDPNLHYYTCCPPQYNDDENANVSPPSRDCLDPQEIDASSDASLYGWSSEKACEASSPSHPYGREMTMIPGIPNAFMCCSEELPSMLTGSNVISEEPTPTPTQTPTQTPTSYATGMATGMVWGAVWVPTSPPSAGNTFSNTFLGGVPSEAPVDDATTPTDEPPFYAGGVPSEAPVDDATTPTDEPPLYALPPPRNNYCNQLFCESCTVKNDFGNITAMNCFSDTFRYPQIVEMTGDTAEYECCSIENYDTSKYLTESPAYQATVWTQFTLALVAALMAFLLVVSVGRSLYMSKKTPTDQRPNSRRRVRTSGNDYSSYNLYLVLLAIPDLVYNLFMLGIVSDEWLNGWIPANDAVITACAVTNQYMNAIIAREVLLLLRRTKDCHRYVPPSLKRAGIQFGIVGLYAAALGAAWLVLLHYSTKSEGSRSREAIPWDEFTVPVFYVLVVVLPAIYLIWVCFEIWWKELLPKGQITIGQRHHGGNNGETPPNSMKAFEIKWNDFRKQISDRFLNTVTTHTNTTTTTSTNPAHDDCLDDTNNTAVNTAYSNKDSSLPSTSNGTIAHHPTSGTVSNDGTAAAATNKGRLNVLAMYFLRIILVFFFLWLPGMIMYYAGYKTIASGLLHNLGLMFFSLQAIVSNGMALTKPDVKKSLVELWGEVTKLLPAGCHYCPPCCCHQRRNSEGTSPTDPNSIDKIPELTPDEEDIEVPIQQHSVRTYTPNDNEIVTVNHEITNIGGIQVSQLTTHTLHSFKSDISSGHSRKSKSISSRSRGPSHKPDVLTPDPPPLPPPPMSSPTTKKKTSKKKKKKKKGSGDQKSPSVDGVMRVKIEGPEAASPNPARKKKKKKSNDSKSPIPKKRRPESSKSPIATKKKSSKSLSSSPTGGTASKKKSSRSITPSPSIAKRKKRRNSGDPVPQRRYSADHAQPGRYGTNSPVQQRRSNSADHAQRRNSGSPLQQLKDIGSRLQQRRNSGSPLLRRRSSGSGSHAQHQQRRIQELPDELPLVPNHPETNRKQQQQRRNSATSSGGGSSSNHNSSSARKHRRQQRRNSASSGSSCPSIKLKPIIKKKKRPKRISGKQIFYDGTVVDHEVL